MGRFSFWGITVIALPIFLLPGYGEDDSIWDSWQQGIPVSFENPCGSVREHATELESIIGNQSVNIVAHSKAGLDARFYISENPGKVANLIMLGTPNEGTEAAYMDVTECFGGTGLLDLWPNSINPPDQNTTNYYTISGNYSRPCAFLMALYICSVIPNDGFVTVESSTSHYTSLGTFPLNHTGLIHDKDVYEKVLSVIH